MGDHVGGRLGEGVGWGVGQRSQPAVRAVREPRQGPARPCPAPPCPAPPCPAQHSNQSTAGSVQGSDESEEEGLESPAQGALTWRGRVMRLTGSDTISFHCATHPTVRAMANSTVYLRGGQVGRGGLPVSWRARGSPRCRCPCSPPTHSQRGPPQPNTTHQPSQPSPALAQQRSTHISTGMPSARSTMPE